MKDDGEIDAVDVVAKDKTWQSHLVFTLEAFGNRQERLFLIYTHF